MILIEFKAQISSVQLQNSILNWFMHLSYSMISSLGILIFEQIHVLAHVLVPKKSLKNKTFKQVIIICHHSIWVH